MFTYEGDAGSEQEDPHQQIFELLQHQRPQGLTWKTGSNDTQVLTQVRRRPAGSLTLLGRQLCGRTEEKEALEQLQCVTEGITPCISTHVLTSRPAVPACRRV